MKAIALANKLARDLDEKSVLDLTADVRLAILDAINGGLQRLHTLAPYASKLTTGSMVLDAPIEMTFDVANSSTVIFGGHQFSDDQLYRTIRIAGDFIDNQVTGSNSLLHPYGGASGTVAATLYADAVAVSEPYDELVSDPRIIETHTGVMNFQVPWSRFKPVGRPRFYVMEANARNQNSPAPSVIRFNSLPDQRYRLEAQFTLAPVRIAFADLLSAGTDIPLRAEQVELYLLPIARDILAASSLWKDKETKSKVSADSLKAETDYRHLTPVTLATPRSFCRTQPGY